MCNPTLMSGHCNCLSETPHWIRKVLSETVGWVAGFISYFIFRMPQGHWGAQGKKLNLPHLTQSCKDVYYSISPIYTMCKWNLNHIIWGKWKNTHVYTIV